ncbi:hypothetical protein MMC08_006589 [Hypocenomyce scalaris]|nr:hypothetical protein [Hypocenomyce scalaris]
MTTIAAKADVLAVLVLVDPPIKDTYLSVRGQKQDLHPITLPSQLFLGGFEDFLDPPSFFDDSNHRSGPLRHALLEDLIYYWKQERPAGFNLEAPTLLSLAYYPLKIVAAEWMNYMAVMSHSIKHYEYSLEDLPGLFQESGRLAADLRALQTWRRRIMSTQHKIQSVVRFIKFHSTKDLDVDCWSFLVDDYNHLANIVDECGRRFENMLPVVTSLVQIVDSRRSFAETSNISRLTYLALVFVPLAYISSLFSMDPDVAPGGHEFWIYFVVAIPVTLAVFLIARPSVWKFLLFRNRIRRLGAPQIPV